MKLYTEESYIKRSSSDGWEIWIYRVIAVVEAQNGSRLEMTPYETEADDTKEAKEACKARALMMAKKWFRLMCEQHPVPEGE
jgi:hypothetical protein